MVGVPHRPLLPSLPTGDGPQPRTRACVPALPRTTPRPRRFRPWRGPTSLLSWAKTLTDAEGVPRRFLGKPSRPRLVPARPKKCTSHVREPLCFPKNETHLVLQVEAESNDLLDRLVQLLVLLAGAGQRPRSPERCIARPVLQERVFFIYNLLVRIHLVMEMVLVDWPCAMAVLQRLHTKRRMATGMGAAPEALRGCGHRSSVVSRAMVCTCKYILYRQVL